MSRHGDLTQGAVESHLIRLTVPMIWGILAVISFQLADTYYLSQLGTAELAAIGFTYPATMFVFSLALGQSIAAASVVSRMIGAGEREAAGRITAHGMCLGLGIGAVIALVGELIMTPLFTLLGAKGEVLAMVSAYMRIWFAASALLPVVMVGNAAMRAGGDSVTPALIMTGLAAINIVLDPLLIFGLYGFPRLEIAGAALATLIANAGMALVCVLLAQRRYACLSALAARGFAGFGGSVRKLLLIAAPAGLTSTVPSIANAVMIALLASAGTEAVAAFGVAARVEAFAFIVIMALATGLSPVIGQNWGARAYDRVEKALRYAIAFSVVWSLGVAAVLALFSRQIPGLFSAEPALIEVAATYFLIVPVTYALGNLVHGWGAAFNAIGRPEQSLLMLAVKLLALQIPLAWLGSLHYGYPGVFAAIALSNLLAGGAFHLRNRALLTRLAYSA